MKPHTGRMIWVLGLLLGASLLSFASLGLKARARSSAATLPFFDRAWDRGAGTNFWADIANWNTDGLPTSADAANFTDTGAGTVDLNGTSQPTSGSLTGLNFNNATSNYTVQTGTISTSAVTNNSGAAVTNTISAKVVTNSVRVNSGTLVLSSFNNTITGPTSIAAGATLDVLAFSNSFLGVVSLNGGKLLVRGFGNLSGSSLTVTANSTLDFQLITTGLNPTVVGVGFNDGTSLNLQGVAETTATLGNLSGSGTAMLTNSIAAKVTKFSGFTTFTKSGAGRLTVTGVSTGSSAVAVQGGTLGGTGTLSGPLSVGNGGTVAPGSSVGTLKSGNFSVASAGGTLDIELDPTNSGGLGTSDNLNVTGTVNLTDGNLALSLLSGATVGQMFQIITNDGNDAIVGAFTTVNGVAISGNSFDVSGHKFQINYAGGNGNDVVLTVTSANNLVVTTTGDTNAADGQLSLREALAQAGLLSGPQTISFSNSTANGATNFYDGNPHTITLTQGELFDNYNPAILAVTIQGPGADLLTISGNQASRVFHLIGSAKLTLDSLTIANGKVSGGSTNEGGGILNHGELVINHCIISGNSVSGGDGSENRGGGILTSASLTISHSTISGNSASGGFNSFNAGGGLYNYLGTVIISHSIISGNSASGGISNSGGGILNYDYRMTLINSTLYDNSVSGGGSSINRGGGIYNSSAALAISNCTISGNSISGGNRSDSYGGGIYNGYRMSIGNSIVAGNNSVIDPDVAAGVNSLGHNLIGKSSGFNGFINGDLVGTSAAPIDPKLGPLGNNGGPTQTLALLPGSPAIDAGDNCITQDSGCLTAPLATDQRGTGFNRKVGSAVDIGAFESNGFTLAIAGGNNQVATLGTAFANPLSVSVTANNANEPVNGGQITFTPPMSGASASIAGNPSTIASGTATTSTVTANNTRGIYSVTASATGTNSVTFTLTNKANTITTVTTDNPDPSTPEQAVTVNYTVTPVGLGAGTPTGKVTVNASTGESCTATVATGSCVLIFNSTGARTLTASYAGDANYNGSTSASEPHKVSVPPAPPINTLTKPNPSDPLLCAGDLINGSFAQSNTMAVAQTARVLATLKNLVALSATVTCTLTSAAGGATTFCAVENGAPTWRGTLAAGQSVTITYKAQVLDTVVGDAQVCSTAHAQFPDVIGTIVAAAPFCLTFDCPTVGPGSLYLASSEVSNQKAGSVLFYNLYSSNSAAPKAQNTRISITNTHPARAIAVHLFFVDGATCSIADSLICLTPNQTASFLALDIDPGTTGYIVAVASDLLTGCPVNFNFLLGDEFVKLSSGHAANLAAESFAALAGGLPTCDANSPTAVLNFDGVSYNRAPRALAASSIPSRADGNDTLLVLNRLGGNLATGAATLSNLFGIFYDDAEQPFSFSFNPGVCQFRSSLSNSFPRTVPRLEQIIPAGRSGWAKFYSLNDQGLLGAQLNFNPHAATVTGAFNQGHNLHKLSLTAAVQLTIPVFPPSC